MSKRKSIDSGRLHRKYSELGEPIDDLVQEGMSEDLVSDQDPPIASRENPKVVRDFSIKKRPGTFDFDVFAV